LTCYTGKASSEALQAKLGNTVPVGRRVTVGANDQGSPETGQTGNPFRVLNHPFPNGGWIESVDVHLGSSGAITIYSYTTDGSGNWTPYASKSLTGLASGANSDVEVGIEIPIGGYVGVYTAGIVSREGLNWLEGGYIGTTAAFNAALAMNANMLSLKW